MRQKQKHDKIILELGMRFAGSTTATKKQQAKNMKKRNWL